MYNQHNPFRQVLFWAPVTWLSDLQKGMQPGLHNCPLLSKEQSQANTGGGGLAFRGLK